MQQILFVCGTRSDIKKFADAYIHFKIEYLFSLGSQSNNDAWKSNFLDNVD